jgi:hypothetical protein
MTEEIHPPGTTLEFVVGGFQLESAPLPEDPWIGRVDRTKELYRAEDRVVEAIIAAAVAYLQTKGVTVNATVIPQRESDGDREPD